MNNRRKKALDSRIDYGVLMPVFLLTLIGTLSIYVALKHDPAKTNIMQDLLRQGTWILFGGFAIFFLIHFSSKMLWKITPIVYLFGLFLMVLPLFFYNPLLVANTGSKNWISIGGFTLFQPSELMKIAFILTLAFIVTQHNAYYTQRRIKTDLLLIAKMILVSVPVALLLKLQDDFGTLLVFVAILGGILLLSGISWRILGPVILLTTALAGGIIFLASNETGRSILSKIGVKAYQFARIDSWLHPFQNTAGDSYQQARGLLAIGSGGLTGKGFDQTDVYIPVRESDMIFTVIAENFGFIGSTFVILLYFILIYRMIRVTFESNNQFYTYIATGIIMMILFHVFENIGSNIGLLPLTGIPLPFISQGGTSLIGNMIGIGLILSMRYHMKPDFKEWQKERNLAQEKQDLRLQEVMERPKRSRG